MSVNAANKDATAVKSYSTELSKLPPDFQRLLETYSKISPDEAVAHVNRIRREAFDICPYPCIGQFKFLSLTLLHHPKYSVVIDRLKQGDTFLDMGCCFAQDMRQMVLDGVPSHRLHGLEIEPQLVDFGYALFQDKESLQAQFHIGDALQIESDPPLNQNSQQTQQQQQQQQNQQAPAAFADLRGAVDIINDSAFLHLFPWPEQLRLAALMASFTSAPGALIVGRMTGSLTPGEYPALNPGTTGWRHNVASLQRLWDEAGRETGTRWRVDGTMDLEGIKPLPGSVEAQDTANLPVWWEPGVRRLLFEVERLE